jgi:hypothetical protein
MLVAADHNYGRLDLIQRNMIVTEPLCNSVIRPCGVMKVGLWILKLGNACGQSRANGLTVVVSVVVGV